MTDGFISVNTSWQRKIVNVSPDCHLAFLHVSVTRADLVRPDVRSAEQLMSQVSTVALQGIFLTATCTGVCMGNGCSLCHTHCVSESTWTCFDLKMTFCSPSKPVRLSGRETSGGEVRCEKQLVPSLSHRFVL